MDCVAAKALLLFAKQMMLSGMGCKSSAIRHPSLAQYVEQPLYKRKVIGANPMGRTNFKCGVGNSSQLGFEPG